MGKQLRGFVKKQPDELCEFKEGRKLSAIVWFQNHPAVNPMYSISSRTWIYKWIGESGLVSLHDYVSIKRVNLQ